MWRRCLCKYTKEGTTTICFLDNDNSNFYEDGSPAILSGEEGDVMVYKPEFYYKHKKIDDSKFSYTISLTNVDGTYIKSPESLIGAYKGYCKNDKIHSISGYTPTVNKNYNDFRQFGLNRWKGFSSGMIDYEQHCMIALMFYAKYGNRNAQAVLGVGSATQKADNTTGSTNSKGNSDTQNETANYVNFLGIEGVYSGVQEWVSGVTINNYVWTITNPDGTTRNVTAHSSSGCIKEIVASEGPFFDLIPTEVVVNLSKYYSDGYYPDTGSVALMRSGSFTSKASGILFTDANYPSSIMSPHFGCRLAFRGFINHMESSSEFKKKEEWTGDVSP